MAAIRELKNVYYLKNFTFYFENKNAFCQKKIKHLLLFSQLLNG